MTLFGVQNPGDLSTQLSAENLVKPLYTIFDKKVQSDDWKVRKYPTWQVDYVAPVDAKKGKLLDLLTTPHTSNVAFHRFARMEFSSGDARQVAQQGALLCSDWPGPNASDKSISPKYYLSGEDILEKRDAINARGMIAFFFACYGAGTPRYDEFTQQAFKEKGQTIAEKPFVAALPKALLSAPRGALAVVGHVERAWAVSFMQPEGKTDSQKLCPLSRAGAIPAYWIAGRRGDGVLQRALRGALHRIDRRLQRADRRRADEHDMARLWTSNNDARGYVILGDPAVRLRPFLSHSVEKNLEPGGNLMFEFGVGEGNLVEDLQQGDMVFNGVNGVTGEYGLAPMPTEKLARLIQERQPQKMLQPIKRREHVLNN
jgi:hypothetical protein